MKLLAYTLVFVLLLSGVTAADYCGTACLDDGKEIYSIHTLYGGDNAIMQGEDVLAFSAYEWKVGETVDFSLEYDSISKILTYTIDGNSLQVELTNDEFKYIVLQGQTSFYGSNSMTFTDLKLDGKAINDFAVTSGIEGIKMDPLQKFFKLEGKVTMDAEGNTNKNMAGVNIYLQESTASGKGSRIASVPSTGDDGFIDTENGTPEIPEFGVVAAGLALIGAVAIFAIRRKN